MKKIIYLFMILSLALPIEFTRWSIAINFYYYPEQSLTFIGELMVFWVVHLTVLFLFWYVMRYKWITN